MKLQTSFTVNGASVEAEIEPRTSLADFLRDELDLTAVHLGCEHGVCGACTVLIDRQPARACITLAVAVHGAEVRTLEGLRDDPRMRRIKEAFHQEHGLQCGFCTPGMLISAWDMLQRNAAGSERQVREGLSGNLCRCTGYQGIVRSVMRAAKELSPDTGGGG